MAAYFFDSSALVKRYINETGTAWVRGITDPSSGARIYVAAITGVEVVAAVARKLKNGGVSAPDAAAVLSQFHSDYANQYRIVTVSDAVISRAMALAETYALRGYDAVQLAAAVETNLQRLTLGATPLILLTADTALLAAGVAEGLPTDDPNTH